VLLSLPPVPRYISYPRTESSAYPSSFDVREVVEKQAGHPVWGAYVRTLLATGGMQVGANRRVMDAAISEGFGGQRRCT
jgi:DNA topoisomerase IA